jgi:hypothetical protein
MQQSQKIGYTILLLIQVKIKKKSRKKFLVFFKKVRSNIFLKIWWVLAVFGKGERHYIVRQNPEAFLFSCLKNAFAERKCY